MARLNLATESVSAATSANPNFIAVIPDINGDLYTIDSLGNKTRLTFSSNPGVKTGNYTANPSDTLILVNSTSGVVTITLNRVTSRNAVTVKRIAGSNAVVINDAASATIDGATTLTLTALYDRATLVAGLAEWHRIG